MNIPVTPPIMSRPIIDNLSSVISLVRHHMNDLDIRSEKTAINTASLELILNTFVKLYESREWEKTQKPGSATQKPFGSSPSYPAPYQGG